MVSQMVIPLCSQEFNLDLVYKKLLVLSTVWIEPKSSAAGYRMLQILDLFKSLNYEVHYATTSQKSDFAFADGISTYSIELNSDSFDSFVQNLEPDAVLYDRFMVEEQFGWRVRNYFPNIPQFLDTEDLHFLRRSRAKSVRTSSDLNLFTEDAKREVAAIWRCDLTFMISQVEIDILKENFQLQENQLIYMPFIAKNVDYENHETTSFEDRCGFLSIGNFRHEPNMDAFRELRKIWPKIHQKTNAELHCYGAYPTDEVLKMSDSKIGFYVKGRADEVSHLMRKYRVLLSPIRFGAGQKGKFFDAMKYGLPSVTTSIGSEAMVFENQDWPGLISDDADGFIKAAIQMYSDKDLWENKSSERITILSENFSSNFTNVASQKVVYLEDNLLEHRKQFFLGEIMKTDQLARYKYLSKYIEAKNT